MTLLLDGRPHVDLNWKIPEEQGSITWEFQLGLDEPFFPLEDELRFQSLALALKTFTEQLWPSVQEKTKGAILYRGTADFSRYFNWSETQEMNFVAWRAERAAGSEEHLKRLFCLEAFAAYFQMLAHRLPDELPLTIQITNMGSGTLAERLHLLLPDRFDHFILDVGKQEDARFGICFPEEDQCGSAVLERIDALLKIIQMPYRAIPETLLTEKWDGIDHLYVLSDALSPRGKRKLMGFCAAGGTVVVEGDPIGLSNEMSAKEFFTNR